MMGEGNTFYIILHCHLLKSPLHSKCKNPNTEVKLKKLPFSLKCCVYSWQPATESCLWKAKADVFSSLSALLTSAKTLSLFILATQGESRGDTYEHLFLPM